MNILNVVKNVLKDKGGNFAIMAALVIPMLVFCAGLSVDFANGMNARRQLQAASDAASLAVSTAYTNGTTDTTALNNIANRYFKANAATSGVDTSSLSVSVSVTGTGSSTDPKYINVAVSGKMSLFMSGVYGKNSWDIAAATKSSIGSNTYYQVAFLLDNSGSMAIGATTADIARLVSTVGCQFACHDPYNYNGGDKAAVAKANGIKLKFDYVQSALNIFVDKLKPAATLHPSNYLMGIFTIGTTFSTYQDMTTNTTAFDNSAASVYLENMIPFSCTTHNGFTNISNGFSGIVSKVGNVGDGTSAAKRKSYIVLISDGVQDVISGCGRQYSANYAAQCASAKAAGFNIIAIQTGYPEMNDGTYTYYIKPLLPTIEATLRACASNADSYIHADDGPAIEAAISKAFQTIFGDIRISS